MMSTTRWTFSDGTVVEHGLRITGSSPFADELREAAKDPSKVEVEFLPHPSEGIPLVPDDDWVVFFFLEGMAGNAHLEMITDYVPTFERAPREAQDAIRAWEAQAENDGPGVVY